MRSSAESGWFAHDVGTHALGQISVTIHNRTYRLSCDDGQEGRLNELADYVRGKADRLIEDHGRISDDHLMLMSAILIADELWDERAAVDPSAKKREVPGEDRGQTSKAPAAAAT